jgi:hypothetical protein
MRYRKNVGQLRLSGGRNAAQIDRATAKLASKALELIAIDVVNSAKVLLSRHAPGPHGSPVGTPPYSRRGTFDRAVVHGPVRKRGDTMYSVAIGVTEEGKHLMYHDLGIHYPTNHGNIASRVRSFQQRPWLWQAVMAVLARRGV